jgi:hypothetical protein
MLKVRPEVDRVAARFVGIWAVARIARRIPNKISVLPDVKKVTLLWTLHVCL